MPDIYERIGTRIREERKARALSLEELAEKTELAPSFLGQIERGERKLSVATLEKVAMALEVPPAAVIATAPSKRRLSWEDRIASLVRSQPPRRKALLFKTLKFLFRQLRAKSE